MLMILSLQDNFKAQHKCTLNYIAFALECLIELIEYRTNYIIKLT